MGKNKLSSGLINVVTYDTDSNISLNSGSNLLMSLSGSGTVTIPGNLVVLGGISGSTAQSASYALNADKLDNLDSTQLVLTSSFNSYTSSASSSLGSLSSSIATTTSNLSSSVSSSIGSLSGSVATTTSNLSSSIGSLSSSVATTTSGLAGRITTVEGNYATTGSNTFIGSQVITGSLYITNDMVVQGCSCLQNITASAVSIGTNTVVLNTATPAVRFAGVSVQDSGSNVGVTGSIYWDGLCNRWVYSNPTGIGYSGGLLISGPRNTGTLGDEVGTTSCALMMGQGGDHITSSAIFHYGNATCLYENSFINSSGLACFADTVCATTFKSKNLIVCEGSSNVTLSSSNNEVLRIQGLCSSGMFISYLSGSTIIGDTGNTSQIFSSGNTTGFGINARGCRTLEFGTNQVSRLSIALSGESTFTCQICTTGVYTTSNSRICGNLQVSNGSGTAFALYNESSIRACISMTGNEGDLSLYGSSANKTVYLSSYYDSYFIGNGGTAKVGIGTSNPCSKLHVSGGGIVIDNNQDYRSLNSSGLGRTILYLDSSNRLLLNNDDGLIRISTSGNIRTCITGTGEAIFACQVCAPQYITTQGSSVSYAAGTNYIVWNSESEVCSQDNNTGGTYTTMKTWIADRTGCLTLRFAGFIQSGPTYWAWRVVKNGSTSFVCGHYNRCLAPGCVTDVHSYRTFQSDIGSVNPGDCITLQLVSSDGGGAPMNGAGQYLYAKELRLHSTTPNFSAGSPSNVFGEWVGIGTCTPFSNLYINGNNPALYDASVDNGQDGCGVTLTVRNNSTVTNSFAQLNLQVSGDSGRAVGRIALIRKDSATADMAFVTEDGNTKSEKMRITASGNMGIGFTTVSNKLQVAGSITSHAGTNTEFYSNMNYLGTTYNFGPGETTDNVDFKIAGGATWATGGNFRWFTQAGGGTPIERMRISSAGVVTITHPSSDAQLSLSAGGSTAYVRFTNSAGDVWGIGNSFSGANTDFQLYNFSTATYGFRVPRIGIYSNTTGVAANVQIDSNGYLARSTSSIKYKTDVKDYDKGLTEVLRMRSVYYKGKNDGNIQFAGLIAEDVHELGLTEFVQYAQDGTPDALSYSNMVALLVKAIQEQQCTINTLKTCLGIN